MRSGIYRIRNVVTDEFYIGSTTNFNFRRACHFSEMKHGTHSNGKLNRLAKVHGCDSFVFEVIEKCLPIHLEARELHWIEHLRPTLNGDQRYGGRGQRVSDAEVMRRTEGRILNHCKIREIREYMGMTQQESSEHVGMVNRSQWNDIESGRRSNITLETLCRISLVLGVEPAELLLNRKRGAK